MPNRQPAWLGVLALLAPALLAAPLPAAEPTRDKTEPARQTGQSRFKPTRQEAQLPPRFRLKPHRFAFQLEPWKTIVGVAEVSKVTFPSPMATPYPANNTVHCEYYRPQRPGRAPAVIVLHILGGDFPLSRLFCGQLARRGVAALFLKMPYYGPRRPPGVSRRMIDPNVRHTVEGMTQAVLDIRRATAWLQGRPEVDPQKIGVFGISLGGITGALAATAEPQLRSVCLCLAGGEIAEVAWESPRLRRVRQQWERAGGTREQMVRLVNQVDPVQFGKNVRGRRILMLNAKQDEIIPKRCTDSLWRAFGKPEIVWYEGGHYSVARHALDALRRVGDFFAPPKPKAAPPK